MYGGTKSELERLVADAAKLDSSVQANDLSFGNLVKAIHAVQVEMGVAGATAEEAASTLEGSSNAMKAAWANLTVGFADENANLEELISNFFNSVVVYGQNLIPRIGVAVEGVTKFLVVAVQDIFPQMLDMFTENFPAIAEKGGEIITNLVVGLIQGIPGLVAKAPDIIFALVQGIDALTGEVVLAGANLIVWLIQGVDSMITSVVQKAEQVINNVAYAFKDQVRAAKEWGRDLIQNFIDGIASRISNLVSSVKNVAQTIRSYLHFTKPDVGPLADFDTYAPDMIDLFTEGLDKNAYKIGESFNKSLDFGVETVPFAQSNYGASSAAAINAMTSSGGASETVDGSINLVTPDGKTLMTWLFRDLIEIAKANGTPLFA